MSEQRPDPEALLAVVRREAQTASRGRLRIWFGAAPGVGKTFAMLTAARRRILEGTDVVIGIVETHGRAETAALLEGMEVLPRRVIPHAGHELSEFDVDAALKRRPGLLVVDELAHTNAPGSRHAKRHSDIREILDAGIEVWTTLNVQHLESLIDVVQKITGVRVHETIPDEVFDEAAEVELVDVAPAVLLERLRQGKVYLPETIERALQGFFRVDNLTGLRELALRRTARWVDARLRDYKSAVGDRRAWPVAERVLVCVGPSPLSATLLRSAHRMVSASRAELLAVHVKDPAGDGGGTEGHARTLHNLRLAESLGARTIVVESREPARAVVEVAKSQGVSRIVIGKSGRGRLRERLTGSFVQDLLHVSEDIDVLVVRGSVGERSAGHGDAERSADTTAGADERESGAWFGSFGFVAAAIGIASATYRPPDLSVQALVLLLGVILVALRHGRAQTIVAALLSSLAFNFLYTEPRFSFAITSPTYVAAFAAMLVCGLLTGSLVVRVREQARNMLAREQETSAMFSLTRELAGVQSRDEIARITAAHASDVGGAPAAVLLPHAATEETLEVVAPADGAEWLTPRDLGVARWVWDRGQQAGAGTARLTGVAGSFLPIRTAKGRAGVLAVLERRDGRTRTLGELAMLETMTGLAGIAIERLDLFEERQSAMLVADRERLRSSLLASVSHDLRTPLATIRGAADALVDVLPADAIAPVREFTHAIRDEAQRLEGLIGNLVFATRLEGGKIELRTEWTSIGDVIASAVRRNEGLLGAHRLELRVAPDLPLVRVDAILLEQALSNVLDNAARHTPPGTRVEVEAGSTGENVVIRVRDDGPGLDLERERRDGLGLGLSICKGILRAHGGSAVVGAGPHARGTEVVLTVPRPPVAPRVPEEIP